MGYTLQLGSLAASVLLVVLGLLVVGFAALLVWVGRTSFKSHRLRKEAATLRQQVSYTRRYSCTNCLTEADIRMAGEAVFCPICGEPYPEPPTARSGNATNTTASSSTESF